MELKLYYLGEVSGMTKEQVEEAEKFIKGFEYGIIATCNAETGPRLSALNNLAGQTLQQLHFATEATTQKLANLRQDPRTLRWKAARCRLRVRPRLSPTWN